MENKYYYLAIAPIIIFIIVMLIIIEISLFSENLLLALLGNFIIAWIFFFMYKANKIDAKCEVNE